MKTNEKMDKDRFRRDLGGVSEAYHEVAQRLGILKGIGEAPDNVVNIKKGKDNGKAKDE